VGRRKTTKDSWVILCSLPLYLYNNLLSFSISIEFLFPVTGCFSTLPRNRSFCLAVGYCCAAAQFMMASAEIARGMNRDIAAAGSTRHRLVRLTATDNHMLLDFHVAAYIYHNATKCLEAGTVESDRRLIS
jgi:hypothetical protein